MGSNAYKLSAFSVYTWCRRGSDFHTPKYRSLLKNAVGVFWGLIIALLFNKVSEINFPSIFLLPAIIVSYTVYLYAYYRIKQSRQYVRVQFHEISYIFDFKNEQLKVVDENGEHPVPIFSPHGLYRVTRAKDKLIISGDPNIDLVLMLEEKKTNYFTPAFAYQDFAVELTTHDKAGLAEIERKFS